MTETPLRTESLVNDPNERAWTPPVQVDLRQIKKNPYWVSQGMDTQVNPWNGAVAFVGRHDGHASTSDLIVNLLYAYDISRDGAALLVQHMLAEGALYEVDGRLTLTKPKRVPWDLWLVAGLVVAIVLGVALVWVGK